MKKSPLAVLCAALLALSLPLSACQKNSAASDDTDTAGEAVTIPPITIPDLDDDRVPTDISPYTERLTALFAEASPAPAADFTYEMTDSGVIVTGYTGGELVLIIPDTLEEKPVTAIAEGAFRDMAALKAVSVPDTVQVIGIGAFEGCSSLTSLRTPVFTCHTAPYFGALFGASSHEANGSAVPVSLSTLVLTGGESVPDYAFYACRGLEVVSLPETLTGIGDFAFYGCQSLVHITTAEASLMTVGAYAFANCTALLSLDIPATVQTMGTAMLEGCGTLEVLTIPFVGGYRPDYEPTEAEQAAMEEGSMTPPADTTYLGYLFGAADYTFTAGYLPASLITVALHEGGGNLPANAFFECASIREITLPDGVTEIGHRAFYGCEHLSAITLPDTVTAIGDDAFHGCIRLTEVDVGTGVTELGVQAFMNCVSLAAVTLPDTVTHLPNACFAGCLSLETLIANGVTTQGKQVFRHCDKLGLPWVEVESTPAQESH